MLVLSIHKQKEYATRAVTGALGYLLKDAGENECVAAVRAVFRGESYLSPAISAHVVAEYTRLAQASDPHEGEPLTRRRREVLQLIAEGLPTKAIARRLAIEHKTVNAHRGQLMERLDIHDVDHLVRYAIRHHLIEARTVAPSPIRSRPAQTPEPHCGRPHPNPGEPAAPALMGNPPARLPAVWGMAGTLSCFSTSVDSQRGQRGWSSAVRIKHSKVRSQGSQ